MMGNSEQEYVSEAKENFHKKDLNANQDSLNLLLQKTHLSLGNEDKVDYNSIYKTNYEEKLIPDKHVIGSNILKKTKVK